MLEAPDDVKEFLSYMQNVKGKSTLTVDEYFLDLRTFFRYMKKLKGIADEDTPEEKIEIDDITTDFIRSITFSDINYFINYCIDERENKAKTRARKTSCLRTFFNYMTYKVNRLEENPAQQLDTPKAKNALPKYLTLEQSIELLNAVDGEYKERDYCILTLFLNCGMRLSELVGIDLKDIRSDNTLRLLGKGNKERVVYLNDACLYAIEDYKRVRPVDGVKDRNALFLSRLKKRISPKTVQAMVYKYLEKIGLDAQGYSVHKLRHTAATLMYQHGNVDIRVLKDILGHENLGTTEIYTHLSNKQISDAINSNPLANVKNKGQAYKSSSEKAADTK